MTTHTSLCLFFLISPLLPFLATPCHSCRCQQVVEEEEEDCDQLKFQPQLFHRRSNRSLSSIGRCCSRWCLGMYGFVFPSFSSVTTARGKSGRCFVGPSFASSLTPSVRLFSYLERSLYVAQYEMSSTSVIESKYRQYSSVHPTAI